MRTQAQNTVDMLLILRAFACLMVLVYHCGKFRDNAPGALCVVFGHDLSWLLLGSGAGGIWIFFTLSGYLMGKAFWSERYSLSENGVLDFYRNRILRIVPLYLFSTLVLGLLVRPELFSRNGLETLLRLLTFTFSGYENVGGNGVLWSISTEMQFYLLVPLLATVAIPRVRGLRACWIALPLVLGYWFATHLPLWEHALNAHDPAGVPMKINAFHYYWWHWLYTPLHAALPLFFIGMLVNPLVACKRETAGIMRGFFCRHRTAVQLTVLAIIFTTTAYFSTANARTDHRIFSLIGVMILPIATALLTASFIYLSEQAEYSTRRAPLNLSSIKGNALRLLEWLGVLTYGIYIWHGPVRNVLFEVIRFPQPWLTFFVGCLATLLGATLIAWVTYVTVELAADRYKKRADYAVKKARTATPVPMAGS